MQESPNSLAESSPRRTRWWKLLPLALPLGFYLVTTLHTVDYGFHWDEYHGQVWPVEKSLQRGVPLPSYYVYPSMDYWLNLSCLLPDLVKVWQAGEEGPLGQALLPATESHEYLLRLRRIRVVMTSLALVWVYLLLLALGRHPVEALLAADRNNRTQSHNRVA